MIRFPQGEESGRDKASGHQSRSRLRPSGQEERTPR